jgi:dihydrofolate reductase
MKDTKLIIIAAVSTDGIIGVDNEIPWKIPEDFQHFRRTTMGNMLLVGYNTYLTLPEKAFEGREYMVLVGENQIAESRKGVYQFRKLDTILYLLHHDRVDIKRVFVAGGAMVYDALINYCNEAIITWVNKTIPNGNKRFPIDNLFANFTAVDDSGWIMSKTGIEYKIRKYVKS